MSAAPEPVSRPSRADTAEGRTEAREGCVHESCWYPACAAPTECGGTRECCAEQACTSPQCPAEFPFRKESDHA